MANWKRPLRSRANATTACPPHSGISTNLPANVCTGSAAAIAASSSSRRSCSCWESPMCGSAEVGVTAAAAIFSGPPVDDVTHVLRGRLASGSRVVLGAGPVMVALSLAAVGDASPVA